jgi:hypothetical protein
MTTTDHSTVLDGIGDQSMAAYSQCRGDRRVVRKSTLSKHSIERFCVLQVPQVNRVLEYEARNGWFAAMGRSNDRPHLC